MSYIEPETEPNHSDTYYDQVINPERSISFTSLVRRLGQEGVRPQDLTGNLYDIVMHGQLVGTIIMESFEGNPDSHINTGALRMKIGEIATLRETDIARYKQERSNWQANISLYEELKPEIATVAALVKDADNHPLQAIVSHVLLSMGALLDDKEDNTAFVGRYLSPQQESA